MVSRREIDRDLRIEDGEVRISIYESAGGIRRAQLEIPVKLDETKGGSFAFSMDDRLFQFYIRLESGDADASRTYQWRTENWERVDLRGTDDDSNWPKKPKHLQAKIVEVKKESWRDPEAYRLEVVPPESPSAVRSYGPFANAGPVTFISGTNRVAFGSSLIDLETNEIRELPGDAQRQLAMERDYCVSKETNAKGEELTLTMDRFQLCQLSSTYGWTVCINGSSCLTLRIAACFRNLSGFELNGRSPLNP